MKKLFATVCAVALVLSAPALAQQTVAPVGDGSQAANSNSQSGSTANNNAINGGNVVGPIDASSGPVTSTSNSGANSGSVSGATNGPINNSQGPVTTGPSTSNSASNSGATAFTASNSNSQGGNADAHATGGTSSATGGTSSATTGASTSAATANPNANNAGNAQSITFNNVASDKVRTVPTVYAPALTTTLTETCMGSSSVGGSWLGGGLSLGSTWRDTACMRRLNARELAQTLGDREAARAVMCGDAEVADAYERLGRPCPKSPNYKISEAAQYMPQLPQPPAPPPPAPPVIVNVPAPAPAPVAMPPVPNPPETEKHINQ